MRISPTDATLNVGQLVTFRAYTTPTRGSFSYRWTVEGDVVGDYSEGTAGPWRTMPLVPSALTARELTLAWRPDESQRFPRNDGPLARRVRVEVSDGRGNCADQVVMQVERNATSATRQAEDWYTSNHARYIAREHALWHQRYPFDSLVYDGAIFFDFHVQFLDRFERWRAEFGYGPIGIWDPATPVPTGVDIDHAPRSGRYGPLPRPAWSTAAGGAPRPWNFMPCDWSRGGQRALTEFPSDRRLLGCAVTETWHNTVHLTVGGDMQDPPTSPRDPLFWRWHRYVDTISRERLALGGAASAAAGAAPPRVVAQFPFRLFDFLTDLGSVSLLFDRPVRGLTPAALTVGGVPATAVAGAGAGPYRFSGFGAPRGAVTVRFAGAGVTGADGAAAADAEWSHTVLPPDGDLDGDGLDNAEEIELALSPPDAADADGDGLSDFEEWRVRGTLARWADSDGDGALDGCEVAEGSDPADPRDAAAGCDPAPVWLCGTRP